MIVYFSGTGNSRFAAKLLAELLGDEILDAGARMKAGAKEALASDRPWVFVAPTYAWRMARVMEDYVRRTELSGSKEAYFVLTCGGDIANAGKYAAKLCEEKGLRYRGTLEVVMPENYIAMFDAPEIDEAREMVANAKPVLREGAECIRQNLDFPESRGGLVAAFKSGPVNEGFYKFYVKADAFRVNATCTSCGACVDICPLNNIVLLEGKPIWGKDCTHCMGCICGCPMEAIEYGTKSKGRVRYRCPEE